MNFTSGIFSFFGGNSAPGSSSAVNNRLSSSTSSPRKRRTSDVSVPTWLNNDGSGVSGGRSPPRSPVRQKTSSVDAMFVPGSTSPTPSTPTKSPSRSRRNSTGQMSNGDLSPIGTPSSSSKSVAPDRFIPNRAGIDFGLCGHILGESLNNENLYDKKNGSKDNTDSVKHDVKSNTPSNRIHLGVLSSANNLNSKGKRLMGCFEHKQNIGSTIHDDGFSRLKEESIVSIDGKNEGLLHQNGSSSPGRSNNRHIPSAPSRVLDAPDLVDDYYLNLLSWGPSNTIAVALNQSVYLWHASDGHIDNLMSMDGSDDYVTSVQWSAHDNTVAIGTSNNTIELWDAETLTKKRELIGHTARVSSLSWNGLNNPSLLSSGSRDATILHHDIRASRNVQNTLTGHLQEICGLAWSPDGSTLASGGNENRLCIWDAAMSSSNNNNRTGPSGGSPRYVLEQHNAAVKAVSWCPWQRNILASGGGTADRTIRIWNSSSAANLRCIDTGSQVCAIQWSLTEKELISSHGFSDNQLILWKYNTKTSNMTKMREFHGHTSRVLHLARSPDGSTICSASADETIRFWDIFGGSDTKRGGNSPRNQKINSPLGGNKSGGLLFGGNLQHGVR